MKKILEQLSRTRFLTEFEFRALFFGAMCRQKSARNSKHVRNRVLETYSNNFFPLAENAFRSFGTLDG